MTRRTITGEVIDVDSIYQESAFKGFYAERVIAEGLGKTEMRTARFALDALVAAGYRVVRDEATA